MQVRLAHLWPDFWVIFFNPPQAQGKGPTGVIDRGEGLKNSFEWVAPLVKVEIGVTHGGQAAAQQWLLCHRSVHCCIWASYPMQPSRSPPQDFWVISASNIPISTRHGDVVSPSLTNPCPTIAWRYHKDTACAGMWLLIIYVNFSFTLLQMNNLFWRWLSMKAGLNCCFFGVDEWRDFRSSFNESLVRNNQREQSRQLCLKKSISSTNNWFLVSCCLGISCWSSPQIRCYLH